MIIMMYVQLRPIFDDWDYLEDQHLLLAVKTADDMDTYGITNILSLIDRYILYFFLFLCILCILFIVL